MQEPAEMPVVVPGNNRLFSLDYLRGLAAFGIMIYHYVHFSNGRLTSETFIGRLGYYGVSVFYLLSGLTLYYVYFNKMKPSKEDTVLFFKKRFFRIFPLLWLVTIVAILMSGKTPDLYMLFLNLTGLFGFINWDAIFSPGTWSIGNELVFYVFFPFFVLFTKSYKWLMVLLSILLFGLFLYFPFFKISAKHIDTYWHIYTNPLNQVFLFLGGFLIGLSLNKVKIKGWVTVLLFLLGLGVFIFYPVTGNRINTITGVNRLVFTACCILVCISFYKLPFKFPAFVHQPLTLLGEASYSLYLLHPIVWKLLAPLFIFPSNHSFHAPLAVQFTVSIVCSFALSYVVYHYFEKFFMRLGKKKFSFSFLK